MTASSGPPLRRKSTSAVRTLKGTPVCALIDAHGSARRMTGMGRAPTSNAGAYAARGMDGTDRAGDVPVGHCARVVARHRQPLTASDLRRRSHWAENAPISEMYRSRVFGFATLRRPSRLNSNQILRKVFRGNS